MPSNTFLNLNNEKKAKIIEVSINEFSSIPYQEVSINKIIMNAGIPRGSFYMYFNDKEDLFEYLMEEHYKRFKKTLNNCFEQNNGDIRKTFIDMYDKVVKYIRESKVDGFFKNVFIYMNINKNIFNEQDISLFSEFKNKININNVKYENIELVFYMLLQNLFTCASITTKNKNFNKKDYLNRLDVMCYGIYKEDYYDKNI